MDLLAQPLIACIRGRVVLRCEDDFAASLIEAIRIERVAVEAINGNVVGRDILCNFANFEGRPVDAVKRSLPVFHVERRVIVFLVCPVARCYGHNGEGEG